MDAANPPPQPAHNNRAVWWFVAASIVVHTVIIAAWRGEPHRALASAPVALNIDAKSFAPLAFATDERAVARTEPPQSTEISSASLQRPILNESAYVPRIPTAPPTVADPAPTATQKNSVSEKPAISGSQVKSHTRENSEQLKTLSTPTSARLAHSEKNIKSTPLEGSTSPNSQHTNKSAASESLEHLTRKNSLTGDEIIQRVSNQLNLLRNYPPLARRRGWEGDVHLAFRVDETGTIKAARIAQSSGFKSLDENALEALLKIKHLAADRDTAFQPEELKLAVRYRLLDG